MKHEDLIAIDIHTHADGLVAVGLNIGGDSLRGCLVEIGNHNACPGFGQGAAELLAQQPRATGDDGGLPFKVEFILDHESFPFVS